MDSFISQRENEAECFSSTIILSLPLHPPHLLLFYLNVSPIFPFPLWHSLLFFLVSPQLTSCILLSICFSPHASLLLFSLLLPSLCCHNTFCLSSLLLSFIFSGVMRSVRAAAMGRTSHTLIAEAGTEYTPSQSNINQINQI